MATPYDRLRELINSQGMSINDLEEKVGLGKNTLYSWKTKIPSGQNLMKVADYFKVSTDYLLARTDNPKVNNGESSEGDSDEDILVAAHMRDDLSEEELEEVRQYIEFLKSKHRK